MSQCLRDLELRCVRSTVAAAVLFLLAVATVGCGSPLTAEQKEAFAAIQRLGGKVDLVGSNYTVDLSNTLTEDDDLTCLKHVPDVEEIDLRGTRITDEGLDHLYEITTMIKLRVGRTAVTREATDRLQKAMPELDIRH